MGKKGISKLFVGAVVVALVISIVVSVWFFTPSPANTFYSDRGLGSATISPESVTLSENNPIAVFSWDLQTGSTPTTIGVSWYMDDNLVATGGIMGGATVMGTFNDYTVEGYNFQPGSHHILKVVISFETT